MYFALVHWHFNAQHTILVRIFKKYLQETGMFYEFQLMPIHFNEFVTLQKTFLQPVLLELSWFGFFNKTFFCICFFKCFLIPDL